MYIRPGFIYFFCILNHFGAADDVFDVVAADADDVEPDGPRELVDGWGESIFSFFPERCSRSRVGLDIRTTPVDKFETLKTKLSPFYLCQCEWPGKYHRRGRLSTLDLLVPTSFVQLHFILKILFYKTSYHNEEVNCTKASPSVSIPWNGIHAHTHQHIQLL